MSESTLRGLLDYLHSTLSPDNMRWMAMNLMAYADADEENLKPYTLDELNAMLDEAEHNYKAGLGIPSEEVFRDLEEEFEQKELQLEMA